jgi:hypothetical protein
MGFGLMIGFIGRLDTARDFALQFTTHTSVHSHIFTGRYLLTAPNTLLCVSELSPYLS